MFNAIVQKLNGHGDDAASLDAALVQLAQDREKTRTQIDELNKERHQALLDDAADEVLDKLERQIDRATVKLEKFTLAEAPLRERLKTAKAAAHKINSDRHFEILVAGYARLREAVVAAEAAQIEMTRLRQEAVAQLGEHTVGTLFPNVAYAGRLGVGMVSMWAAENDAVVASFAASRAPKPEAPAKKAAPVKPKAPQSLQHPVGLLHGVQVNLMAKPIPDDLAPLGLGQVRAKVLRAGYCASDDSPQCGYGQVIRLPLATAERAAAAGVIEILEQASGIIPNTRRRPDKTAEETK